VKTSVPEGYRPFTGKASAAVQAKAIEVLAQDYGYQETATIDGKNLLFLVEEHTWYGADPSKPSTPHKGVTVFEQIPEPDNGGQPTGDRQTYPAGALPFVALGIGAAIYFALKKTHGGI